MDVKSVLPFLDAVKYTLEQFGVSDIKRGGIQKKESLHVGAGVSSVIGIVGSLKGNVAYSMSMDTAKKIVSTMMMGMPVETLDEMAQSAIGELSNMITGHATVALSESGYNINITPPIIMVNDSHSSVVSFVNTIAVNLECSHGIIEVNIGLDA